MDGMESKELHVNVDKTKVMVNGVGYGVIVASGECPCAVCKKNVCNGWVHKMCNAVYSRLRDVTDFECAICRANHMTGPRMERIDVGDATLECVDEFCYLSNMIGGDAQGSSIMSQVWLQEVQGVATITDNEGTLYP